MSKPKVYFACSITAANFKDRKNYGEVVGSLKQYCEVLTELFVDHKHLAREDLTDEGIFERDVCWLKEADAIVAEVSVRSHGVGIEVGMMSGKKPILCLYKKQEEFVLSAMISGDKNIIVKEYKNIADLSEIFDEFFASL